MGWVSGDVDLYSDGRNKVCKVSLYSKYGIGIYRFLFHNEELISYGGVWDDRRFYLKHLGKEIRGRIVEGKRFGVKKRRTGWEIEVEKGKFSLRLDYITFGKSKTPFIEVEVKRPTLKCVIFPEFDKVYRGKDVDLKGKPWGLQVEVIDLRYDELCVYMLMLDGRENLVYKGDELKFHFSYSPAFYILGNVIVVDLDKVDRYLKEHFFKAPGFSYLFVNFYHKDRQGFYYDPKSEIMARISFDLENWIEVKAGGMIFKKEEGLRFEDTINVNRWLCERTSNKIQKALEEIMLNITEESREELSPSLGG